MNNAREMDGLIGVKQVTCTVYVTRKQNVYQDREKGGGRDVYIS